MTSLRMRQLLSVSPVISLHTAAGVPSFLVLPKRAKRSAQSRARSPHNAFNQLAPARHTLVGAI